MDVIKNILLEQDIDVGIVDKGFTYDFYDPSTKFSKNLSEKDEIDYFLKNKVISPVTSNPIFEIIFYL
jgi:hypothetical protein